ncbi:MAG: hydroxymethylbilane synthase [Acidihalobacter sp.]|uniref:hydroxymethylbilane synthase n=1 Tax=Acidihalobacter sp. TaxID=1872108 RepID=UPI00307E9E37
MKIRIGTRRSALAMWQARFVADCIRRADPTADTQFVQVGSIGDSDRNSSFQDIGGIGVFTKSGEAALIAHEVDIVVHSLKDLPTTLPEQLVLASIPKREDPRDVLCGIRLEDIKSDCTIGTGSIRRSAQLLSLFPDINIRLIRGNVPPRLRKAAKKEGIDGTLLAASGLKRLGLLDESMEILSPIVFPYAVGQGALGIECRSSDSKLIKMLKSFECSRSRAEIEAERALLHGLQAGCNLPVGVHGWWVDDIFHLNVTVTSTDGTYSIRGYETTRLNKATAMGTVLAMRLIEKGAGELLKAVALTELKETDSAQPL